MPISAVLLDLEGVLYQSDAPIEGAREALRALEARGLALRYVTNTTTTSRIGVLRRLEKVGLEIDPGSLFTPLAAAHRLLEDWDAQRVHLAAVPETAADFADFQLVNGGPADAVVMGDLYKDYGWERINLLFTLVRGGARLIALHKNRYCRRDQGIGLDAGPFVAAVEYAAGVEAVVVGKPAAPFFQLALADLGVAPADAVMVGDDIEADIGGAQGAGLKAVQVETGKYTPADQAHPRVTPDGRISSIAALPAMLEGLT